MKIVLDTNVLISGIFFTGPPYQILKAWRDNKLCIMVSQEILEEYWRVAAELSEKFPNINIKPFLELLTIKSKVIPSFSLQQPVSDDADDDKFISCALASESKVIISGDKHLLKVSGYNNIEVITPRVFVDNYIPKSEST